jgi:hypothetical protein
MEVVIMATTILILMAVLVTFTIFPLIGNIRHTKLHHPDLMAGDEGED